MSLKPMHASLPLAVLLFSSSLWGLSWWPLKEFVVLGLGGPMLSMLVYGPVGLALGAFIWRERAAWRPQAGLLIALAIVGGWANTSFVNALMLGDVVRVMFLFYLSPVWSVLGGWLFLGENVSARRKLAVGIAVIGLWLVLGGTQAFATKLNLADLLAITSWRAQLRPFRFSPKLRPCSWVVAFCLRCGLWGSKARCQHCRPWSGWRWLRMALAGCCWLRPPGSLA
jgi:drug/metabolite transporter (DMT)-like permease